MRYHSIPIRMDKILKSHNNQMLAVFRAIETHSLLIGIQNGTATLEDSLAFSFKTEILLPYNSAIILLGIYPEGLKTYIHAKICPWCL